MVDMYVLVVCDLGRTEVYVLDIVKMSGTIPKEMEYLTSKIRHINGIKTTST